MGLTTAEQTTLALIPKFTAGLSVFCSSIIVYLVLRDPSRRAKVYHRLILGMSLTDIMTSFWWVMSTWPVPRGSGPVWAVGTTQTCTCQGFFLQVGIANPLYNLSLSTYFLLAIHWSWGEEKLRKVEPLFHLGPLGWGITTAIIGLPLKIFNNANLWCWIADLPGRNENTAPFRWGIFYAPLWAAAVLVSFNLAKVVTYFQHVTRTYETRVRSSVQCQSESEPNENYNHYSNRGNNIQMISSEEEIEDLDIDVDQMIREKEQRRAANAAVGDEEEMTNGLPAAEAEAAPPTDYNQQTHTNASTETPATGVEAPSSINSTPGRSNSNKRKLFAWGGKAHSFSSQSSGHRTQSQHSLHSLRQQNNLRNSRSSKRRFANTRRRLAWQCLGYALVFYMTWFPITLLRILQAMGKPVTFPLLLSAVILTPLQGSPNFLIYLFPLFLVKLRDVRSSYRWRQRRLQQRQRHDYALKEEEEEEEQQQFQHPHHPQCKRLLYAEYEFSSGGNNNLRPTSPCPSTEMDAFHQKMAEFYRNQRERLSTTNNTIGFLPPIQEDGGGTTTNGGGTTTNGGTTNNSSTRKAVLENVPFCDCPRCSSKSNTNTNTTNKQPRAEEEVVSAQSSSWFSDGFYLVGNMFSRAISGLSASQSELWDISQSDEIARWGITTTHTITDEITKQPKQKQGGKNAVDASPPHPIRAISECVLPGDVREDTPDTCISDSPPSRPRRIDSESERNMHNDNADDHDGTPHLPRRLPLTDPVVTLSDDDDENVLLPEEQKEEEWLSVRPLRVKSMVVGDFGAEDDYIAEDEKDLNASSCSRASDDKPPSKPLRITSEMSNELSDDSDDDDGDVEGVSSFNSSGQKRHVMVNRDELPSPLVRQEVNEDTPPSKPTRFASQLEDSERGFIPNNASDEP